MHSHGSERRLPRCSAQSRDKPSSEHSAARLAAQDHKSPACVRGTALGNALRRDGAQPNVNGQGAPYNVGGQCSTTCRYTDGRPVYTRWPALFIATLSLRGLSRQTLSRQTLPAPHVRRQPSSRPVTIYSACKPQPNAQPCTAGTNGQRSRVDAPRSRREHDNSHIVWLHCRSEARDCARAPAEPMIVADVNEARLINLCQ